MKQQNKPEDTDKGLGDTIARITHMLKLDEIAQQMADLLGKEDCGCKRRQEKLNEMFPYKKDNNESL